MQVIKNGTIVNADSRMKADIKFDESQILEIGENLNTDGCEVIDATGKFILPGCIDPHVHFREPGLTEKEDFYTGSQAALAGGVTTVADMPNTIPHTTDFAALRMKRELAKKSLVNTFFYIGAVASNIDQLVELFKEPDVIGIKIYMGSSTGNLLLEDENAWLNILSIPNVIVCVHAESEYVISENSKKFADIDDPDIHSVIRGNEAAETAVRRICDIGFRFNARLHICHLSSKEELAVVKEYKERGYTNLSVEVAAHHLFFSTGDYVNLHGYGKVNPPLRAIEDRNALWEDGIALGLIDMVASDHAPHLKTEKVKGYWDCPSGMPGVQEYSSLLLDKVHSGELSLEKFVELRAGNPARIFGLEGLGEIKEGNMADMIIVDMERKITIDKSWIKTKCGWSNYDGISLFGAVEKTFVGGQLRFSLD